MEYTPIILGLMGMLGVLLQSLVKMDSLNKQANGDFKLMPYLKLERFSILISIIVVICCTIASQEIESLKLAGNWIGLGFVGIGYLAQSLLIKAMGKAQKKIDGIDPTDPKP